MISFRCRSKTTNSFWTITIDDGSSPVVQCSCPVSGEFCAHVDATLVHGESFMVHEDDRAVAYSAARSVGRIITVPAMWKATWKSDRRWRGLDAATYRRKRSADKPTVCFTGEDPRGLKRPVNLEAAKARGWNTLTKYGQNVSVVVAADPRANSTKLRGAREDGVPIITYEEWEHLSLDGEIA